jgi:hypothetical protein
MRARDHRRAYLVGSVAWRQAPGGLESLVSPKGCDRRRSRSRTAFRGARGGARDRSSHVLGRFHGVDAALVAIELRDRILYPYSFGNVWANALTRGDNWTAVIHGCTGVVAMALEETGSEEAFEHVLIRREGLLEALTGYFQTAFSDDGYPLEGGAYWELGYRAWLDFAELADRLGKPVFELAFSPSARAANFGIRGAGQKGTAAAIGDSRLGRKLSAVTARRAARRYGLALPDWAESMRFASFTEAAFWLLGTDATEPRKYPPTGELYRGIARLSTITAAGSRFELFVHALPWTGLPHDQQAIGSWALHREGNPISGDPGYPKPYRASSPRAL